MKRYFLPLLLLGSMAFASESGNGDASELDAGQAAVLIQIAAFSGEALKLDGVLEPKKAKKKCTLLFGKAGAEGDIKTKSVEICTSIASGKENYFPK